MNNYTILHLHTHNSNGTTNVDSVTSYSEYISKAKELGMTSLAFTEHGNVYEWLSKKRACEKNGIKYIHGCEIYITESLEEKKRDNYHTVLLAKNYEGFKEINSLISLANSREDGHFYYTPRITMDDFVGISDNVIVLSACLGSVFGRGTNSARKRYLDYFLANKDRCFLEIQHHNVSDQIEYNRRLYTIAQKTGLKLVTATDTHSLNSDKERGRAMLQKSKNIFFGEETGWDLTMKSYEELVESYKVQNSLPMDVVMDAIEQTNIISDMIETFDIDTSHKYPQMAKDPRAEVLKYIAIGIKEKGINKYPNAKEYAQRIIEEVEVYDYNGAFDFLLLMKDIVDFCKREGIKIGYGRGSVTGSLVAYLLGITQLDSVKENLIFSRFMHNERVSLSDIDTDFMPSRRQEVRDYLFSKENVYCSDIVTFNTIAMKKAIENIGRAMGLSPKESAIIKDEADKDEAKARRDYPEIFEYVDIIIGTIESVGIHPAGVIVSPFPIEGVVGTYTSKDTPNPISQLNMKEIDSLNFVKLDLLGLDAVEVIAKACDLADIDFITPDTFDDEDDAVWKELAEDTSFIFQLESDSAKPYFKKLLSEATISKMRDRNPDFKRINLLSIGNGAIRPSGASYRDALASGDYHDNGHEAINKIFADTQGFCLEENQKVHTINGIKRIKDINEGDIVYTKSGTGTVTKKFYNGVKNTVRITYGRSELVCTKEHEIFTQRGWVKAGELTDEDSVAYRVNTSNEGTHDTNNLRLIGWLIGDGGLTVANQINFTNANINVVNSFINAVESNYPSLTCSVVNRTSRVNHTDLYRVGVKYKNHSKVTNNLTMYLRDKGLKFEDGGGLSSLDKFIPEFIFTLNREHMLSFLGAYTDTDSTVKARGSVPIIAYKTASKKLAYDIQELTRLLGYRFYVTYDKVANAYQVNGNDAKRFLYDIYNHSVKVRENFTILELKDTNSGNSGQISDNAVQSHLSKYHVSRKRIGKVTGVKSLYSKSKSRSVGKLKVINDFYPDIFPKDWFDDNIIWIPINEIIDNNEKSNVYDIEVDGEHNYIAQGIVVHNCVFQEQISSFLINVCGFSAGKADMVRRSYAKKYGTEQHLPEIKAGFIKHMSDVYNMPEHESEELIVDFLQVVEDASEYLFNLNHAQAYSYMGYAEAWLRHHYPLEFVTAFMEVKQSKQDDIIEMTKYAKSKGMTIELPKYGIARNGFTMDKSKNTVYKGTASIKSVNKDIGDKLYYFHKMNSQLTNFADIIVGIIENKVSGKANLITLAKVGFFRDFGGNAKTVKFIEDAFGAAGLKYDTKHADKTKEKRIIALREHWENMEDDEFTVIVQIQNEMEYLGYGETVYPDMPKEIFVVKRAEDRSWCVVLNCYNIQSGENNTMYMNLKHRVGIKKLKDYGILKVESIREDRSGRSWIESFTLLQ